MAKQPKPVRAWGVYDSDGLLLEFFTTRNRADDYKVRNETVVPGTFTPDLPKRAKKRKPKTSHNFGGGYIGEAMERLHWEAMEKRARTRKRNAKKKASKR